MANYFVIEFDDGMQLVPKSWLDKKKVTCYFPEYDPVRYNKAVRNDEKVKAQWKKFSVKRILGRAENFEEGKNKLRRAEDRSDLDESTDFERSDRTKFFNSRPSEMAIEPFPETPKKGTPGYNTSSPFPVTLPHQAECRDLSAEKNGTLLNKIIKIEIQLEVIQNTQQIILNKLQSIEIFGKQDVGQNLNVTVEHPVELPKLLLTTLLEVQDIEEKVKDIHFKKYLVLELQKLGGRNLPSIVNSQLHHLLSLELATKYSYCGKKEKQSFSALQLCHIVADFTRHHLPNTTDTDVKTSIQTWLRHAKEKQEKTCQK